MDIRRTPTVTRKKSPAFPFSSTALVTKDYQFQCDLNVDRRQNFTYSQYILHYLDEQCRWEIPWVESNYWIDSNVEDGIGSAIDGQF